MDKTHSTGRGKKAGLMALTAVLVLLVVGLLINAAGAGKLRGSVQEARRIGGPLTFEEIMEVRPKLPDKSNGADLLLSLDRSLVPDEPAKQVPLVGDVDLPPVGVRWSEQTGQAVERLLGKVGPNIEKLRKLQDCPGGVFPLDLTGDPVALISAELPRLALVRHGVRLQSLATLHRAMSGDNTHLAGDMEILFRHSQIVCQDPLLVALLTAVACDALSLEVLQRAMALGPVSPEQLMEIERVLAEREAVDGLAWAMRGERAFFLALLDQARSGGLSRIPGFSGWQMWDEAQGLHIYNQLVEATDRGVPNSSAASALGQTGQAAVMTLVSLPSVLRSFELVRRGLAEGRCARTALAVERYRLATGRFPADLEALVPDYIGVIPADPYATDRPLRMVEHADRLVVYSVGPGGVDDQGDVALPGETRKGIDVGFTLMTPGARGLPPAATAPHVDPVR